MKVGGSLKLQRLSFFRIFYNSYYETNYIIFNERRNVMLKKRKSEQWEQDLGYSIGLIAVSCVLLYPVVSFFKNTRMNILKAIIGIGTIHAVTDWVSRLGTNLNKSCRTFWKYREGDVRCKYCKHSFKWDLEP